MLKALYQAIRGDAAPVLVNVNDRPYSDKQLLPVHAPAPDTLHVRTLTALVDYVTANVDNLATEKLLLHVESPAAVSLQSALLGDFDDRKVYIRAELDQLQLPFGKWLDSEQFNISLQACFCEPEGMKATDRGLVLKYISNVSAVAETGATDDGISQAVTVKIGIASKSVSILPNPVTLRPFRTFTEVEQPASDFIFRCRPQDGAMSFSLTSADGGAWRAEAMQNIKDFMEKAVPGLNVIA